MTAVLVVDDEASLVDLVKGYVLLLTTPPQPQMETLPSLLEEVNPPETKLPSSSNARRRRIGGVRADRPLVPLVPGVRNRRATTAATPQAAGGAVSVGDVTPKRIPARDRGDRVDGVGPRGKVFLDPDAHWHLFLGDESAAPASLNMLEALPESFRAWRIWRSLHTRMSYRPTLPRHIR